MSGSGFSSVSRFRVRVQRLGVRQERELKKEQQKGCIGNA